MIDVIKKAFYKTIPVMAGYIVLGIGFGILLHNAGYGMIWAFAMSALIYAGSMQYVGIGLLTGGASVVTTIIT
ncbi:MAG: AzlC family ABC transporter permease, partial [Butyrivibrio sp.]|nr:AzlC family ABC transporter permease [Butyrivibrio sp.]